MLYRSHLNTGLAAGVVLAGAAQLAQPGQPVEDLLMLAGLTAAFALVPDLDVASVPQRWFYRGVALALAVLLALDRGHAAGLLGFFALLPLVHHHRGWMHRWWAAAVVPAGVLLLGAALLNRLHWPMEPNEIPTLLRSQLSTHLPFYCAMALGYATHLVVDRVGLRALRPR